MPPVEVEAELKRRNLQGALVGWAINDDGTDPVADAQLRASVGQTTDLETADTGIGIFKRIRTLLGDILTTLNNLYARQGDGNQKTQVTNFPATQVISGAVDVSDKPLRELGKVEVKNPTANPETGLAKDATLVAIRDHLDTVETKLQTLIDQGSGNELVQRLMPPKPRPADGYTIWFDTADSIHIYVLEAPVSSASGGPGFRGIRITKDANGNPVGKVEINTNSGGTLTFDSRTSASGWA